MIPQISKSTTCSINIVIQIIMSQNILCARFRNYRFKNMFCPTEEFQNKNFKLRILIEKMKRERGKKSK